MGWQDRAACRDVLLDFVDGDALVALRFCATCPVRLDCLALALTFESFGVWGGHYFPSDERQRRRVRLVARRELRALAA